MRVEDWNVAYASEVETWHYEPPRDFYDLASDPGDAVEMRDSAHAGKYRAVLGESGRLYRRLGFDEVARETRQFELVGEHEFIRMERAA